MTKEFEVHHLNHSQHVMMKCGHAANSICNGKPACAICAGLTLDAHEVVESPDLTGRIAKCLQCGKSKKESKVSLPFFHHYPDKEYDGYYCGCAGWN